MKNLVVLGAGESGVGAAVLGKKQGWQVTVSDSKEITEKYKKVLLQFEIPFEEGGHSESLLHEANTVVKSPGIPDTAAVIKELLVRKVPVISEIEFAGRYTGAKMIGITGSNGKTTTTMLLYHVLKRAGLNVGLAGNVGQSLAMQVAESDFDYYVLELSSFQLDGMYDFKVDIAILLNITPDHLDRYDYNFDNYVASKFRITQNQGSEDSFIFCADDERLAQEIAENKGLKATQYSFSIEKELATGAYLNKHNELTIKVNHKQFTMSIQELALQGKHNIYNTMAAGIAGRILEIRKDLIRECFSDFQNIEHRLEVAGQVCGMKFVNDSKATNVNSTWYALETMDAPIVWIVGGVDKGNDYSKLMEMVQEKVASIICLGVDNSKIHEAFGSSIEHIYDVASMSDAVAMAYRLGTKGDTILLSPACASFDLFDNYEDRGHQFKNAVRSL